MRERTVAFRELFGYYQPRDGRLNIDLGGIASCSHAHKIKKRTGHFLHFCSAFGGLNISREWGAG